MTIEFGERLETAGDPPDEPACARATLPQLRNDLVIIEQTQSDSVYYVIKDPVSLRYFRIVEDEFNLLRMLDGKTSAESIARSLQQSCHLKVEVSTVQRYIDKLSAAGFLTVPGDAAASSPIPPQATDNIKVAFFSKVLMIRIRTINPDAIFDRLINHLGLFFNRYFVGLAAASILAATIINVAKWGEITTQMRALFALHYVLGFWVAALLVAVLHECAHGLTCKRFGGEVREIGFLLVYFQPALYCNVSDAWLFKERSKRLWVMFGGGFFESFIWALAVLVWSVTPPYTAISQYCLIIIAISGVKILFNFNPLIKLDGYYLLSDYLGVPNLRRKAFTFARDWIKRNVFGRQVRMKPTSRRERRIYVVFSLLALPYSIGLILLLFWKLGVYLVSNYQSLGLLILITLLLVAFGDLIVAQMLKLFRHPPGRSPQSGQASVTEAMDS